MCGYFGVALTLAGRIVLVECDNSPTVAFLNCSNSHNATAIQWPKLHFYASLQCNFRLTARRCSGVNNIASGALSRLTEADRFPSLFNCCVPERSLVPFSIDASSRDPNRGFEGLLSKFAETCHGLFFASLA